MFGLNRKSIPVFLGLGSLMGIAISFWQTRSYLLLMNGSAPTHSFCDLGQTFDCTAVEMSKYAEFLPGFPLSGVAIAGYAFILLLSLWQIGVRHSTKLRIYQIILTGIALLFSLVYFSLMLSLGKFCLLCLILDLINIGLFSLAILLPPSSSEPKIAVKGTFFRVLGLGLVSLIFSILIVKNAVPKSTIDISETDRLVNSILSEPVQNIIIPKDAENVGAENAKITIIEFGDFQCPPCKFAAAAVAPLFKRYGPELRFVFLNFPWATECNAHSPVTLHPFACEAAAVAICANRQEHFLEAYESLFEHQASFEKGKIASLTEENIPSLNAEQMSVCLKSNVFAQIKRDADLGSDAGIKGTPTFFINGRKVNGLPTEVLVKLIDHLLARSN